MTSNQADVLRDRPKTYKLHSLAGAMSQAWQYCRFKTKEGNVLEPSQVRFLLICLALRACELQRIHIHQ